MPPEILDVALRGGASSLMVIIALLVLLVRANWQAKSSLLVLSSCSIARIWGAAAPEIHLNPEVLPILRLIGTGSVFGLTWFIVTIFLDEKRFARWWLWGAAFLAMSLWFSGSYREIAPFQRAFAVTLYLSLLGLVLYSARGDLLNARRRLRPGMSVFIIIYSVNLALTSTPMIGSQTVGAAVYQSSLLIVFTIVFSVWALQADPSSWPAKPEVQMPSEASKFEMSRRQTALIGRINRQMEDGIWQVEGLTVGGLAQKVNAPEHQVRKAINQELGYRNFASFINRARIEAAKVRLRDPNAQGTTVLEIAYEVGFSSLGPFNRSFKKETGQSPTDFRKSSAADGSKQRELA